MRPTNTMRCLWNAAYVYSKVTVLERDGRSMADYAEEQAAKPLSVSHD